MAWVPTGGWHRLTCRGWWCWWTRRDTTETQERHSRAEATNTQRRLYLRRPSQKFQIWFIPSCFKNGWWCAGWNRGGCRNAGICRMRRGSGYSAWKVNLQDDEKRLYQSCWSSLILDHESDGQERASQACMAHWPAGLTLAHTGWQHTCTLHTCTLAHLHTLHTCTMHTCKVNYGLILNMSIY